MRRHGQRVGTGTPIDWLSGRREPNTRSSPGQHPGKGAL